jgi:raffinose/stachyose/melibiose transport system substrate-binding protein
MAAVMVIVMLAALTGCVGKEDTQTRKKNKVVEIPMILSDFPYCFYRKF